MLLYGLCDSRATHVKQKKCYNLRSFLRLLCMYVTRSRRRSIGLMILFYAVLSQKKTVHMYTYHDNISAYNVLIFSTLKRYIEHDLKIQKHLLRCRYCFWFIIVSTYVC